MLPYYNKNIIENLSDRQIDAAYLKKQEENIIYDVREAIANYEKSGYTNASLFTAEQMLSDDEFVSRVVDNYYDQLCDNREDIYAAIDSVIESERYSPQVKVKVHPSEAKTATKRLFVDMDGTLARFHDEVQYLERMYEKGFFAGLKPFDDLVYALQQYSDKHPDVELFILSSYVDGEPPYCIAEKNEWLDKYMPFIPRENRLFPSVNQRKSSCVPGGITDKDILLDDYTKNLIEWTNDGGSAIKAKNNINCKGLYGEVWLGDVIDITNDYISIVRDIEITVNNAFCIDDEILLEDLTSDNKQSR